MINKKNNLFSIVLFLLAFLCITPLVGQVKDANKHIGHLINQNNLFELNREYPKYQHSIKPALSTLTEVLLYNANNQIDKTLVAVENLVKNHQELGFEPVMNMILLWGKLLIKKGEYKEAYQLLQHQLNDPIVQQHASKELLFHLDNVRIQAEALQYCPKSSLKRGLSNSVVSLIDGNKVPAKVNGNDALFILDTGADGPAFVSKQFAIEHKIKIFPQVIHTSGTVNTGKTNIGFIDSLEIGNVVYRNFWTLVSPDNRIFYNDTVIAEIDAVLGRHFMDDIGEIHFLPTEKKIIFPVNPVVPHAEKNILLVNGQPYIEVLINRKKYPLHLDTGGGIALYSNYFRENKSWVIQHGKEDSLGIGGFGGSKRFPIYSIPSMKLSIAGVPTLLEEVPVFITDDFNFSKNNYGMLGMDVLSRFYKVIFNFKDMYFKIERL